MSLVNIVTVDLSGNTIRLVSHSGATLVEQITYSQSTKQITFAITPRISLNLVDFNNLINQIVIFQTAIVYNFSPGSSFVTPFNSFVSKENYIPISNSWTLQCNEMAAPIIVSYTGSHSLLNIALAARASAIQIPFSEWVMLLASQKHYESSINTFFSS
jgi:tricorn protease-like protein